MKDEYRLFYKDIFLGMIVLDDSQDFPIMSGRIGFSSDTNRLEKELRDYIDFSIISTTKVLIDKNDYEKFIDKEEFKYKSIIESLEWGVISKDGVVAKILAPIFFTGNGINFRFQLGTESD